MIDDTLRQKLVAAIANTPWAQTEVGRDALLAGIRGYFERNRSNGPGDIMIMILQLEENYEMDGTWRLLKFIDNAAATVSQTDLGKELQRIRQELQKALRPRTINPAETAQVHLFDLRRPVIMCVGQLPQSGGVSGFVVPGATPRLLRYFCDSLRHRGAEYQAWTRDRVAAASPMVVGPLQTAVVVATSHIKKLQQVLVVKHVFWPVYVEHEADAAALWQGAQSAFEPQPKNHLIVVFGMPDGLALPAGMKLLPSPQFTSDDVEGWVMDIAKARAWQESLIKRWTAVIVMGYAVGGALPMDIVYDRLERCHGLVNEHRDDEQALLQELQDLEAVGVT